MLLELNTIFEGYTVIEMTRRSSSYREEYHVKNLFGHDYTLVVYDLNSLPECFAGSNIPEFDTIKESPSYNVPFLFNEGKYKKNNTNLAWMVLEYSDGVAMTDFFKNQHDICVTDLLHKFYELLVTVDELPTSANKSCHNNINGNTVVVTTEPNGSIKLCLTDLSCASAECTANPTFDTDIQDILYRAPETILGRYNASTDVFALGILLASTIQGKHPWQSAMAGNEQTSLKEYIKLIRQEEPVLEMDDDLKKIVSKAIATKTSLRYKNAEEFCKDLEDYLKIEESERYTVLKHKNESITNKNNKEDNDDDEDDESYNPFEQIGLAQPKANVRIERVEGNGFKDVAGMQNLKGKLTRNFIDIVKNRELAKRYNITPPNGILLWGPPGNGKTFITRKLAEESGLLFCLVKPSDLGNIYVHGSQNMIADLFKQSEKLAKKHKCGVLLVFDEFDSLVPKRDGGIKNNNSADEVAEFLTRLNDCAEKNIYVVATTNRIEAIDPAVIRKGRIDEVIYVGLPDEEARKELLKIELKQRPHEDIDIDHVVEMTKGFSSSDISFIVKECARCSFEKSLKTNNMTDISQSLLEKTISSIKPSVSSDEMRHYEALRDNFEKGRNSVRPRIGFNIQ